MNVTFQEIDDRALALLSRSAMTAGDAAESAWACAWLQACGYEGVAMLVEAFAGTSRESQRPELVLDAIGIDLAQVSCVFTAPQLARLVVEHRRIFLRNVRHGLYLLPFAVRLSIGIGCPVDPAFALGGKRSKNPYEEKLAAAREAGITVNDEAWRALESQT
jgi:hypothetical protein